MTKGWYIGWIAGLIIAIVILIIHNDYLTGFGLGLGLTGYFSRLGQDLID
jgi:type IV secretory pathway TrbD component